MEIRLVDWFFSFEFIWMLWNYGRMHSCKFLPTESKHSNPQIDWNRNRCERYANAYQNYDYFQSDLISFKGMQILSNLRSLTFHGCATGMTTCLKLQYFPNLEYLSLSRCNTIILTFSNLKECKKLSTLR